MSCTTTNIVRIRIRRDTAARWNSFDPVLCLGEIGYDSTINNLKIGDGVKKWSQLNYLAAGTGGTVWGGIIGDITDQIDLVAYINSLIGTGGGEEITNGAKQTAMQLNSNWGATDNYDVVMINNVSTVTTGQNEHDYFYGTSTETGAKYKYEIGRIGGVLSVVRILMRY